MVTRNRKTTDNNTAAVRRFQTVGKPAGGRTATVTSRYAYRWRTVGGKGGRGKGRKGDRFPAGPIRTVVPPPPPWLVGWRSIAVGIVRGNWLKVEGGQSTQVTTPTAAAAPYAFRVTFAVYTRPTTRFCFQYNNFVTSSQPPPPPPPMRSTVVIVAVKMHVPPVVRCKNISYTPAAVRLR